MPEQGGRMVEQTVRILLAEDDYLVCEEIKRALRELPHELVGEADNGEEAVRLACDLKPDVVLMDIKMPRVDGLEASRRIQRQCPAPIVILTAHESRDLLEEARNAGVGAYLTKPPRSGELTRAIAIATARHADLMELARINEQLRQSLEEIKSLRGILPVCSYCKKVRNDQGYYEQLEQYLHEHAGMDFSHTICPRCVEKHFPEYAQEIKDNGNNT